MAERMEFGVDTRRKNLLEKAAHMAELDLPPGQVVNDKFHPAPPSQLDRISEN